MTAASSRFLGPRFRGGNERGQRGGGLFSFSRRTPGPRDHGALNGNQKDIEPPWPPRHGARWLFNEGGMNPNACQRKARCTGARSVAAAPPQLLGLSLSYPHRFPGERQDPRTTEH